jgi:hypothetical protein
MNTTVVEAALKRWQEASGDAYTKVGEDAFELESGEMEDYKGFLMVQNYESGEIALHYFVPVAVVEDIRATPTLMAMNRGGAKDSDFFFSLTKQGELVFLLLEAKAVDRAADEEAILWRISNWWESEVFSTPWELPDGVVSIHPGFGTALVTES